MNAQKCAVLPKSEKNADLFFFREGRETGVLDGLNVNYSPKAYILKIRHRHTLPLFDRCGPTIRKFTVEYVNQESRDRKPISFAGLRGECDLSSRGKRHVSVDGVRVTTTEFHSIWQQLTLSSLLRWSAFTLSPPLPPSSGKGKGGWGGGNVPCSQTPWKSVDWR